MSKKYGRLKIRKKSSTKIDTSTTDTSTVTSDRSYESSGPWRRVHNFAAKLSQSFGKGLDYYSWKNRYRLPSIKSLPKIGDHQYYRKTYLNDPIVNSAMNLPSFFAVKEGYTIVSDNPKKKEQLEEFFDGINTTMLFYQLIKESKIHGTSFAEISPNKDNLVLRSAETMEIVPNPEYNGDIEGFIQKVSSREEDWKLFDKEQIIFLENNPLSDELYGISDIESIRYVIEMLKDKAEQDVAIMLDKYAGDRFIVTSKGDGFTFTPEAIESLEDYFKTLRPGEDIIVNNADVSQMEPKGHAQDFRAYLDYILLLISIGTNVPTVFWFGAGSTEATAKIQLKVFETYIKFLQENLSHVLNTQLIPRLLGGGKNPKIKFNAVSLDDQFIMAKTDMIHVSQGIRSPQDVARSHGFDQTDKSPLPVKPEDDNDTVSIPIVSKGEPAKIPGQRVAE